MGEGFGSEGKEVRNKRGSEGEGKVDREVGHTKGEERGQ